MQHLLAAARAPGGFLDISKRERRLASASPPAARKPAQRAVPDDAEILSKTRAFVKNKMRTS
jgi:hypothetical protein